MKKMEAAVKKSLVLLSVLVLLALCAGCGGVKVIPHPAPELKVDLSPFEQAGCAGDWEGCAAQPALAEFGCDRIQPAEDLLGGLGLPLAECWVMQRYDSQSPALQEIMESNAYFHQRGCLLPVFVRYIAYQDGTFRLLKTPADWLALGGPLDASDKALSYALAATGLYADFDLKYDSKLSYYTDSAIEQTSVEAAPQGWRINLFDYQFCGCGPHDTSRVDVGVGVDGSLTLGEAQPLFRDPAEDGLCVD